MLVAIAILMWIKPWKVASKEKSIMKVVPPTKM
jgi:hypothetical protein